MTVNDLSYDWPQGFAKFGFSAMNPDRDQITKSEMDDLARALGAPVRIIYVHI